MSFLERLPETIMLELIKSINIQNPLFIGEEAEAQSS